MATRCNVILKDSISNSKVFLYRHWDGYPAETGADLIEHLKAAALPGRADRGYCAMLTSLITAKRGGEGHDKDRAQYEVTDSIHGDIEHCYTFLFNTSRKTSNYSVTIQHQMRRPGEELSAAVNCTPEEFVGLVNADRVATNKRIAELKASSAHYADLTDYPMVSL